MDAETTIELRGIVTKTHHSSPTFSAGRLRPAGRATEVSFAGRAYVKVGDTVTLRGSWVEHEKYGRQFSVDSVAYEADLDADGLAGWLASHADAAGIGPTKARAIAAEYGESFGRILMEDPEQIAIFASLTLANVTRLAASWAKREEFNRLATKLSANGLTRHEIESLYREFGGSVLAILEADPYAILDKVDSLGFAKIDGIAQKMGVSRTHAGRIQAGIRQALNMALANGSTCEERGVLIDAAGELLKLDNPDATAIITSALDDLAAAGSDLRCVGGVPPHPPCYAFAFYVKCETLIADVLATGGEPNRHFADADVDDLIERYRGNFDPDPSQREALRLALRHRVCVISGAAGCGKTSLVAALVRIYRGELTKVYDPFSDLEVSVRIPPNIALCAPTGKAARRLSDVTGHTASTIHRLLEYHPKDGFGRDADNPLNADVVIVDECFPAGTLVDVVENGVVRRKPIELIAPGDSIYNASGEDIVVAVKHKEVSRAILVKSGSQEIVVSENHRFFTRMGWICAQNLRPGDSLLSTAEAVRLLRKAPCSGTGNQVETVLQHILLNEMVDAISGVQGGRSRPSQSEPTIKGHQEVGQTGFDRVDSIEILEQGDSRLEQFRDASGKLYFYDLQALQHPSFSVCGLLVHNCSMVDVPLAFHLLSALRPTTALVIVGDHHQLPPVGPGAVLRDALAHRLAPAVILDVCHRQAGTLKHNCNRILAGVVEPTAPKPPDGPAPWIAWDKAETPDDVLALVERLFVEVLPRWGFGVLDCQIMTPIHKGPIGTQAINVLLQRLHQKSLGVDVAPTSPERKPPLYIGDKVICVKNNYQLDIMNGHQGRVLNVKPLVVDFDGRAVGIPSDCKGDIELAFALSVHKMQGSQIPVAVFIAHRSHGWMLSRNLIYTACTRASQLAVVIGDTEGVMQAAERVVANRRKTLLGLVGKKT